MKLLINQPNITWLTGILFGIAAAAYTPLRQDLYALLVDSSGSLLGTTVSLMGFVIAALAIVLATPSRSIKLIREKSQGLWKQLTTLFTQASGTFGVSSIFLLIAVAAAPDQTSEIAEVLWVILFVGLLVMCILQITKVIGLLDLVIQQA